MKICIACGMPLENSKDIGGEMAEGAVCIHCVGSDGKVKSCEEIFEGGTQFFMSAVAGVDRALAEKLTRNSAH